MLKTIKNLDLFGHQPTLYYKSNQRKSSWFGFFLTIIYVIMYVAFFIYKIVRMVEKLDVTFYESFGYDGDIPSVVLSKEIFGGGIGIKDPSTGLIYVNDSIYELKAKFKIGQTNEKDVLVFKEIPLNLTPCRLDLFGSHYQDVYGKRNLNNFLCFNESINGLILEGFQSLSRYSYFDLSIYRCRNTSQKHNCLPIELIDKYLTATQITVTIQDIELTPQDYSSPVKFIYRDLPAPLYKEMHQEIYGYMQMTYIETEQNIIGFEALSNVKKELHLKYDTSMIIATPNIYGNYEHPMGQFAPMTTIRIQLANKVLTQKRYYPQLIDVLGDVGGLMEVFYSLFNIISSLIVGVLYEESLVNDLFSFDLDRKIINLKGKNFKKKITMRNKSEHETIMKSSSRNLNDNILNENINIKFSSKDNILIENNKVNEISSNIRNIDNDKNVSNMTNKESSLFIGKSKVKKKKKKKRRTNIQNIAQKVTFNFIEKEKVIENNDNIFTHNKKEEDINIDKKTNIEEDMNNDGLHGIVNKIILNKFLVHTLCCIARYPKNLKNILLDEGIKIIRGQLEIFNLFAKLYKIEKEQKESDVKECVIEMSRDFIIDYNKLLHKNANQNLDKSF